MNPIRKRNGFSLIELAFTLAVIGIGLGSFYAVMYRGLDHMKIVSSKNYALVAASSELEIVGAMPKNKLPETYDGPFMGAIDLSPLANAKGLLQIERYDGSGENPRVVTATVTWTVVGMNKRVSLSTLVGNP